MLNFHFTKKKSYQQLVSNPETHHLQPLDYSYDLESNEICGVQQTFLKNKQYANGGVVKINVSPKKKGKIDLHIVRLGVGA